MYYPWVHHTITTRWIYHNHALDIIVLAFSTTFHTYDITSCDASCDHDHMPLHCPQNKIKRKEKKKRNKIKENR